VCVKAGSPQNHCVLLLSDGLTCPGGLGEYSVCYGVPPIASDYTPNSNTVDSSVPSSHCGVDKAGKWRNKKCRKKQEKGKCYQKKSKKNCKATCPSC